VVDMEMEMPENNFLKFADNVKGVREIVEGKLSKRFGYTVLADNPFEIDSIKIYKVFVGLGSGFNYFGVRLAQPIVIATKSHQISELESTVERVVEELDETHTGMVSLLKRLQEEEYVTTENGQVFVTRKPVIFDLEYSEEKGGGYDVWIGIKPALDIPASEHPHTRAERLAYNRFLEETVLTYFFCLREGFKKIVEGEPDYRKVLEEHATIWYPPDLSKHRSGSKFGLEPVVRVKIEGIPSEEVNDSPDDYYGLFKHMLELMEGIPFELTREQWQAVREIANRKPLLMRIFLTRWE